MSTETVQGGVADEIVDQAGQPWRARADVVEDVAALERVFASPALNVADVLCDAHPGDAVAFTLVDADAEVTPMTYAELATASRRLSVGLSARGIGRGDRVAVLMGKRRELPIALLAIWRLGAVHVPLFTAFASPAIEMRVRDSNAKLIITEHGQHAKVEGLGIETLLAGEEFDQLLESEEGAESNVAVGGDGLIVQLYTSGTTGTPKAVGVPGRAIGAFVAYMRYGLDVGDDDTFWNAADPGWAYGLYYGIIGPLAIGKSNVLLAAGFSPELTATVIEKAGVTNFAAAPTVYRALKAGGLQLGTTRLRRASSAGEPLTPDVTGWAPDALGVTVRDHYGQTEHGMVIVNAWHPQLSRDVRSGSMGQVLPGFAAGTKGTEIVLATTGSPLLWFDGYLNAEKKTRERYTPDRQWYRTGDVGRHDGEDFFFASRDDDVILAAGYRIGPFDVESIIVQHPDVAEAAVVGRPDELRGEVVEAFVVPAAGAERDDELRDAIKQLVREQLGAYAYPRRVHFVDELPKTPSGKVQRFILRSPEYGADA
ncbi:AMP-binding protein [Microbacterium sp.]|uniref:AMP-binding protein n=1 Tax=Microbacterium sp. TaxID=51671 RepID=UPI003A8FCFA2